MASKITDNAQAISEIVLKDSKVVVEGTNGTINTPEGIWEKALDMGGVDAETFKKAKAVEEDFATGSADAIGKLAVTAMKDHKDLQRVQSTMSMFHKDKLRVSVERERSYPVPNDPEAAPVVKHGVMTLKHEVYGTRTNVGQIASVFDNVNKLAAEALKK